MWLFVTLAGVFAVSENLEDTNYQLFGGAPPSIDRAVRALVDLENGKVFEELASLIESLPNETFKVDNELLVRVILDNFKDVDVKLVTEGAELKKARDRISEELLKIFGDKSKYNYYASKVGIGLTQSKIMEEGEKRDQMIIKAVTIQEDLTKMYNILVSHVREWYGFYFHELGKVVEDHDLYIRLVYELGRIENFTRENIEKFVKDKKLIDKILKARESAVPIKITDLDLERIKGICELAMNMNEEREKIMDYLDTLMREAAPNIRSLVGSIIGAKLIRKAGGLEQLAKMPASTIQILGAEKALFRALHGRGTPPKHGIIFQDPRVFKSPRWQRGKIARALAGKLAIAARVDFFSGEYIGDELASELDKRIEEIKAKYPNPPPPKPKKERGRKEKRGKKRKGKKKSKR
ncbi:MAG: C/D box methylation guide ribonucleoprotein complex aNOP56 subunit [Candidatus Njordarchaeia archaeon]